MAKPLAIDGLVEEPEQQDSEDWWRRERARLDGEMVSLRRQLEDATREKETAQRALLALRSMLGPLYRALRAVFGEINLAVGEEASGSGLAPSSPPANGGDPRLESFKRTFPGCPAEIIDALAIHGDMKMTNLAKLLKRHYDTVRKAAAQLRGAGAVSIDGGTVRLR